MIEPTAPTPDELRTAFRQHPGALAIATAAGPETPIALLVSSLTSVSASPPIVSLSISDHSKSGELLLESGQLAIHLLTARDQRFAILFSQRGRDRSHDAEFWRFFPGGEPRLPTAGSILRGVVGAVHRAGGSKLVLVEIFEIIPGDPDADALVYWNRNFHTLPSSDLGFPRG